MLDLPERFESFSIAKSLGVYFRPGYVCDVNFFYAEIFFLLLARLMGQYCFARWRLSSIGVVCRRL